MDSMYPAGVTDSDDHFNLPSVGDESFVCATDGCEDECDPNQELCPACLREAKRKPNWEWAEQYRGDE